MEKMSIKELKPKVPTIDALIEQMERQGIKFTIESKDDAKDYLQNHNYYLKIMSYRENYQKNMAGPTAGQYLHLEYAYLKELAIIDMHLRYILLEMCLDLEHALKLRILNHMNQNDLEDGYETVKQFIDHEKSFSPDGASSKALKEIEAHRKSVYCQELIDKYYPDYPIWVFIELIPFGELISFYDFYLGKYGIKNREKEMLNAIRDLRNATAHSNCIINKLVPGNNIPNGRIVNQVYSFKNLGKETINKKMRNKCIYDITTLLLMYNDQVKSEGLRRKRFNALHDLVDHRMVKHGDWFQSNSTILSSYNFIKTILDGISPR